MPSLVQKLRYQSKYLRRRRTHGDFDIAWNRTTGGFLCNKRKGKIERLLACDLSTAPSGASFPLNLIEQIPPSSPPSLSLSLPPFSVLQCLTLLVGSRDP